MFVKVSGAKDGSVTYVAPFLYWTWICVLVTPLVAALIYFVTGHFGKKTDEDVHFDVFTVIHGLVLQGVPYEPKKLSSRIAFQTIFLAGVLIFAFYSSCLTSFLAAPRDILPFTDKLSLLNDSNYKIVTMYGTALDNMYRVRLRTLQFIIFQMSFSYLLMSCRRGHPWSNLF